MATSWEDIEFDDGAPPPAPAAPSKPMGATEIEAQARKKAAAKDEELAEKKATESYIRRGLAPKPMNLSHENPLDTLLVNAPTALGNAARAVGSTTYETFRHPVEAVVGMGKLVRGLGGYFNEESAPNPEAEEFMRARGVSREQDLGENIESAARGVFANPLQGAMDIGAVTGTATGSRALKRGAGNLVRKTGEKASQTFMRGATPKVPGVRGKMDATAAFRRENEIPSTGGGLEKAAGIRDRLGSSRDPIIQRGDAAGQTVPTKSIYDVFDDLRAKGQGVYAADKMAAIDAAERNFIERFATPGELAAYDKNPNARPMRDMPLSQADAIKQDYYQINFDKYRNSHVKMGTAAQKAATAKLVEEIHNLQPDLIDIDAQYGPAKNAVKVIEYQLEKLKDQRVNPSDNAIFNIAKAALGTPATIVRAVISRKFPHRPDIASQVAIAMDKLVKGMAGEEGATKRITLNAQGVPVGTTYMRGMGGGGSAPMSRMEMAKSAAKFKDELTTLRTAHKNHPKVTQAIDEALDKFQQGLNTQNLTRANMEFQAGLELKQKARDAALRFGKGGSND